MANWLVTVCHDIPEEGNTGNGGQGAELLVGLKLVDNIWAFGVTLSRLHVLGPPRGHKSGKMGAVRARQPSVAALVGETKGRCPGLLVYSIAVGVYVGLSSSYE